MRRETRDAKFSTRAHHRREERPLQQNGPDQHRRAVDREVGQVGEDGRRMELRVGPVGGVRRLDVPVLPGVWAAAEDASEDSESRTRPVRDEARHQRHADRRVHRDARHVHDAHAHHRALRPVQREGGDDAGDFEARSPRG